MPLLLSAGYVGGKFLICGTCALTYWTVGLNGKWQIGRKMPPRLGVRGVLYHKRNYIAAIEAYHKLYPQLNEEKSYSNMDAAYKSGRYDLSNSYLEQAAYM